MINRRRAFHPPGLQARAFPLLRRIAPAVLLGLSMVCAAAPSPRAPKTQAVSTNADPVELELRKIMIADDEAQDAADRMIKENNNFKAQGAGIASATLNARIRQTLEPVKQSYAAFIERHPKHARARLAYGSFLNDTGEDYEAMQQWEKSRQLDPTNPAAWNNLANYFGHRGPVEKTFEYYAKAIELNPNESVYYHNLGTTVFLFRKDAAAFYKIGEQQVFDKALELYQQALKLDPKNFPLASDVAQTYYGIKPARPREALAAWEHALTLASDSLEREGVYIHFARLKIQAGEFDAARRHLSSVTNEHYKVLKDRVEKNLVEREAKGSASKLP